MNPFNIIDGLNELFDATCVKQVVSRLTRNPVIWKFLADARNFNYMQDTLGDDPSRWTVTGVLESAAGLSLGGDGHKNLTDSSEPSIFMSEIYSVSELSALSLRVQDYIKDNSFKLWLDNLPMQIATEDHLWQWAAIVSIIFPGFENPLDALYEFTLESHIRTTKLLAYTTHSDQIFAEYLLSHLDGVCRYQSLTWLVPLISHLEFLGDFQYSKEIAIHCLDLFHKEKTTLLKPDIKFEELLKRIADNRSLIFIAKIAEKNELLREFQDVGKVLLSGLLNKTGISNYDPAIFEDFSGFHREEFIEGNLNFCIQQKIEKANSFLPTDSDSTKSIAKEIYQSVKREFQGSNSLLGIGYSQRQKIIDLLQFCNLIVECADLIDKFLIKYPDDIELLRIAARLNNIHGNHAKAVRYYKLLNMLVFLSRVERIAYAESLAYQKNFYLAYEVRSSVNALDIDDSKKLLVFAFNAELNEEIDTVLKSNLKEISKWPLSQLLTRGDIQKGDLLEVDWKQIWAMLSTNEEKILFINLLEENNKNSLIMGFLEASFKESLIFSSLTTKLVQYYQQRGDYSSISDTLASVQLTPSVSQKELEEGIDLLIQNGFIEKASQWLDQFKNQWRLSPIKNLLQAEISLQEEDFHKTEKLLQEEVLSQVENEKSLVIFSLALLSAHPKSFPIGFNSEKITELKDICGKFEHYQDFSDITLRILGIYLNKTDRISLFEKELSNASSFDNNNVWRIKAAIGNEYFNRAQFDLAIRYFKEVERILPFNPILLKNLLESYLRLKLTEEAEVILHRMLAADGLTLNDLIHLSFDKYLSDEWISFLDTQKLKFPDSQEIQLLFALSSMHCGNYADAIESTKIFLAKPELTVNEKLIAAQILVAAGDHVFAERIIEIMFSGSINLDQTHYLTAALIYQSIGNFSKALVMLNHLQPFDRLLSCLKLDLMIRIGNYSDAVKYLQEMKPDSDFVNLTPHDLPLIDSFSWQALIDDHSFFERTAARVWIANKDFSSAIQVFEEGFKQNQNDELLAYQLLEIAKLTNRTDLLDVVQQAFDGKEIQSNDLICSLGESAFMRGQEMLAAHYLSKIIDTSENQLRPKALQSIILKRNGNESDAKWIYSNLITEIYLNVSGTNVALDVLDNQLWFVTAAYEMDDFSKTLLISQDEITRYGRVPGLVNIYLRALLGLIRQNVLFEILNCSSQVQNISEEQKSIFKLIEKDLEIKGAAEFDDLAYHLCKIYIEQESSDIDSLLETATDRVDLRDLVYLSMIRNGYEKTELEYAPKMKDQKDLIFFASLIASEHPEKSLELIHDHINLLSNNPIHLALLAKIYFRLENLSEAHAAITLALNIDPEEYGWEILAGEISQKKGDMIAAIEHFERANRLSKKTSLIEQLNDLNILTGSEMAIPVLESKFAENPGNFDLAMKIASLCLNFNKPGKAAHYFETASKLNPKDHQPYTGLSRLSVQIGNLEKAHEYASKGLLLCERDLDLLLIKTDLITRTVGLQEAKDFLENHILLNDDISEELQASLADLIYEMYGLDECLAFISAKILHDQHSEKLLTTRVKYLLIAGDNLNAKESLEKMLEKYPDNAEVDSLMGDYYRIQGDLDQAIGHYLRAINLDPSCEKYFMDLFEIYNDQRDSESAVETLRSGMKAHPYSIALPIRLAKYFLQHGLVEQANSTIERALRLRPHDEEAGALKNLINQQNLTQNHDLEMITE